jgi:hypothetical protein
MSQHKRNTIGMHKALRDRRNLTVQRINKMLEELSGQDYPITFSNIAKLGGVSKAWLYRHPEIKQKIDELRSGSDNEIFYQVRPESKKTLISSLRARIKDLEAENSQLRKQLEIVYGELHIKNK